MNDTPKFEWIRRGTYLGENDDRILRLQCPICQAMCWVINKEFAIQAMRYCPHCGARISESERPEIVFEDTEESIWW